MDGNPRYLGGIAGTNTGARAGRGARAGTAAPTASRASPSTATAPRAKTLGRVLEENAVYESVAREVSDIGVRGKIHLFDTLFVKWQAVPPK
jgi:hypothetical protein